MIKNKFLFYQLIIFSLFNMNIHAGNTKSVEEQELIFKKKENKPKIFQILIENLANNIENILIQNNFYDIYNMDEVKILAPLIKKLPVYKMLFRKKKNYKEIPALILSKYFLL